MMKSLKLHRSKRWWTVVGICSALVLGILGYGAYSVSSWQAYHQRVESWRHTTKQTLVAALSLEIASETDRSLKLTALKEAVESIRQTQVQACAPARLTEWQGVLDNVKKLREACEAYSQKVTDVIGQLDKVTAYLDDETQMTKILQPAIDLPKTVSEKDWDKTATTWTSVHAAVSSTTVSEAFVPTKEHMTSVVTGINTSWKELKAAHSKKDKSSFVAAVTKLQKSYEAIGALATVNSKQLSIVANQLQSLYEKL